MAETIRIDGRKSQRERVGQSTVVKNVGLCRLMRYKSRNRVHVKIRSDDASRGTCSASPYGR